MRDTHIGHALKNEGLGLGESSFKRHGCTSPRLESKLRLKVLGTRIMLLFISLCLSRCRYYSLFLNASSKASPTIHTLYTSFFVLANSWSSYRFYLDFLYSIQPHSIHDSETCSSNASGLDTASSMRNFC